MPPKHVVRTPKSKVTAHLSAVKPKKKKAQFTEPVPESAPESKGPEPPKKPRCKCRNCKCSCKGRSSNGKCCSHFPTCWNLPLLTTLQFLAVLDIFVAFASLSLLFYFHQFEPFSERLRSSKMNASSVKLGTKAVSSVIATRAPLIYNVHKEWEFHESTTILGPPLFDANFDKAAELIRYSKFAYVYSKHRQAVETNCGEEYYSKYLFSHNLNVTRQVFLDILVRSYGAESFYLFLDLSILITTTAFFSYTSAKVFLILLWETELFVILVKLWTIIASRSQRLCILEFGFGEMVRGDTFVIVFHLMPTMGFRLYKTLVYTYFIKSFFTSEGYLQGEENTLGESLKEFVRHQQEYKRTDINRKEDGSSEEDEIEHMI